MPMSFSLFSFDFFEAFRRARHQAATDAAEAAARAAAVQSEVDDRDRQTIAERAFWGPGYFPLL